MPHELSAQVGIGTTAPDASSLLDLTSNSKGLLVPRMTRSERDAITLPATGLVIVEIYRLHKQFLGLIPPGMAFLPQEVVMHAYTMMPLPSAAAPPSYAP